MSKEDILLSIEELAKKNTEFAAVQVALSKEIEKMRPEVSALEGRKSVLMAELAVIEKRISEKEAQRNEDLNKKDQILKTIDDSLRETRLDYDVWHKDLEAKENALRIEEAHLTEAKSFIDKGIENLTIDRAAFAKELSDYGQKISDLIADQKRLADLRSFIETQQMAIDEKEKEVERRAEEISKKEEALASIESLYAQREAEFREKDISLVDSMMKLNQLKDELKKREDAVAAKEIYSAGEIKIIDEEKKKLQLGWLQINKKIQDNKIDMELKELQK